MPTPSPKPPKPPKKGNPYKYKTTKLGDSGVYAIEPMTTAELNAEKAKAPAGTSVWRDPSVGYDRMNPPQPKKIPKGSMLSSKITKSKMPKGYQA